MTCSRLISIRIQFESRREAKFRATSTKDSAQEIVSGLVRSFKSGLPVSLQFVADRNSWPTVCLRAGQKDLGERMMSCVTLFARGELRLDNVGLLVSDTKVTERLDDVRSGQLRRVAILSLGLDDPKAWSAAAIKGYPYIRTLG